MEDYKILPVGDQALIIEFGNKIDEEINQKVIMLASGIRAENIRGIIDVLATYRSVMVYYDKSKTNFYKLSRLIKKNITKGKNEVKTSKRKLLIPCCYEEEFAPDLADMEKALGLSKEEIINIHTEVDYKVFMLGFLPGFVYLGGLDKRIHMPRLDTPRKSIPERSVGIGGNQTGVYPMESPGGWRLIGKTPIDFYNPAKENPILCQAGDYIHFYSITASEYRTIRHDVENDKYEIEICY